MSSLIFATTHKYLPDRTGGSEISTHALCKALQEIGWTVAVVCGGLQRDRLLHPPGDAFALSVDVDLGYPVYRAKDPARCIPFVARLQVADAVVLHLDRTGELLSAAVLSGIRVLVYLRDVQFAATLWRLRELPHVKVIANSQICANRARNELGLECDVVHPLVIPENYIVDTSLERVLFVNPVPKKGVELAISLAKQLPHIPFEFREGWPLSTEQRTHYMERVSRLKNVSWCEITSDMRDAYRHAKLILVPSVWEESWGRVVTEAQLSGIPAVCSLRGGLPESIGDGGMVV